MALAEHAPALRCVSTDGITESDRCEFWRASTVPVFGSLEIKLLAGPSSPPGQSQIRKSTSRCCNHRKRFMAKAFPSQTGRFSFSEGTACARFVKISQIDIHETACGVNFEPDFRPLLCT